MTKTVNPEIRLPISGLAEFITSTGRSPIARLRPFKLKRSGEAFARTSYYQPAISAIRAYHSSGNSRQIIDDELSKLGRLSQAATKSRVRARLDGNTKAINAYLQVYGNRQFRVLPNRRLRYKVGGILVSAQPDLWVDEHGTQVLVKIGIAKKHPSYVELLLSLLRKAAIQSKYRIRAKNIVYLNVSTGKEIICSGGLTRFNRVALEAAAEITALWDTIA